MVKENLMMKTKMKKLVKETKKAKSKVGLFSV